MTTADSKSTTTYTFAAWIFLRIVGLAYFSAFASLGTQVQGLLGTTGILPVARLADIVARMEGISRFLIFPSVYWLHPGDQMLQFICWVGALCGLFAAAGVLAAPALFFCWVLWLSLVVIGQDFLSFQWDILLLETGFLSMFLAPWRLLEPPWRNKEKMVPMTPPPVVLIWLVRWLLFRLMFESGVVKLSSGDPTWASLTALNYHYLTQPLPTPLSWVLAKLPEFLQKFSCGGVFLIELVLPFFIVMGRRMRLVAAAGFFLLQVLIAAAGNYAYFNLLTVALACVLVDDRAWEKVLRGPLRTWFRNLPTEIASPRMAKVRGAISILIAFVIGVLSLTGLCPAALIPSFIEAAAEPLSRFYLCNTYGLFAVMTTTRDEIIIEGSADGKNWLPYEFKFKPGDLQAPPCIIAPMQPRLDWQMWFAALAPLDRSPWFAHFMVRLFQGSPEVLALLKSNPFPNQPPKFLRAQLYRYDFSDSNELFGQGQWWRRQYLDRFAPEIGIDSFSQVPKKDL